MPWLTSLSWTLPVASRAHVRRNLLETEPFYPEGGHILRRIGQLYAVEAEARRACPEELLAVLAALRAKESKPVIDEIRTSLMAERAFPRSALGKAIHCPRPVTLARDLK